MSKFDCLYEEGPEGDLHCVDCKRDVGGISEIFATTNKLWCKAMAIPDRNKFICIGCLESRLGRRLRPEEFPSCEINDSPLMFRSHRLIDRMTWTRD